jgi:hypothetical protein
LNVNPFEISELQQIWIIDSSIISRAEGHTTMRPTGTHLGLDKYGFKLKWVGSKGMSWINIVPIVLIYQMFWNAKGTSSTRWWQ